MREGIWFPCLSAMQINSWVHVSFGEKNIAGLFCRLGGGGANEVEADEEVNRFLKFSNALDARDDDDASQPSLAITAGRAGALWRPLLAMDTVEGML